jgi:tape measure domain-containing protein
VLAIARETTQPLENVTELFQRYKLATTELGASQEQVLDFTKRLAQATALSGASAAETRGALIQLAQGIGTNFKAAGQELRSIQEQAPIVARIIAKAAGGEASQLLALAKAGKISAQMVFDAVRAEGARLDADFAKRKLRFEDVSTLFGIEWLQLMKRLEPMITFMVHGLTRLVKWTREWIEDGSAMNTVIAGAITAVAGLSYVFGGLALSAAAAAAPFLLLFGVIEDLVGFIRGDQSLLEEWLDKWVGKEKTERIRQQLTELSDTVKGFFAALGSGPEADMAAWRLGRAFTTVMKAAWDEISEYGALKMRSVLGDTTADLLGIRKPGESERDAAMDQVMRLKQNADTPNTEPTWAPIGQDVVPAPIIPQFRVPDYLPPALSPRLPFGGAAGPALAPTNNSVTNHITVQGNADTPVAREIATRTGDATIHALGRDRSAVGAGFGLTP